MRLPAPNPRSHKGSVAIEVCAALLVLVPLLAALLVFGRILWHYSVVKHVASNAAHYVAQGTWPEISSGKRTANATTMAQQAVHDAGIAAVAKVTVVCQPDLDCTTDPPNAIQVAVSVKWDVEDDWFGLGSSISSTSTASYAN